MYSLRRPIQLHSEDDFVVFYAVYTGHRLKEYVIKNTTAFGAVHCMQKCLSEGPQCKSINQSCADLYKKGATKDGIYTIDPDGQGKFKVRCDMTTSGGGWTVFQRWADGSCDFYRGWNDYKNGFGDLDADFWLGLDKINRLSNSGDDVLRVDLEDFENEKRYANYAIFAVANETEKYKLTVGDYSG